MILCVSRNGSCVPHDPSMTGIPRSVPIDHLTYTLLYHVDDDKRVSTVHRLIHVLWYSHASSCMHDICSCVKVPPPRAWLFL